ncbi:MAG: pilus assembly protein TadG-related protein [Thalassovita sp.]
MKPEHDKQQRRLRQAGRHIVTHLNRFRQEEDGVMVAFSMLMLLTMLVVGGIGVDIMRYEMDRARLQNTVDRAVLAAADLDQELDADDVVNDYFTKAGLAQYLSSVDVQTGLGSKRVEATAEAEINTFFLKLMGIDTLTASANGAAMESIDGLEISLVLDVSGSMSSNSRLTRLKPAAKDFVETILGSSETGNVSISVIPYATQVNAGAQILDELTVTSEHSYSNCVNFGADEFSKAGLDTNQTLERTAHFDPFTESEDPIDHPVCAPEASREILPLSNSESELKAYIDALYARGNTSIDVGMQWGTLLLDNDMEDVVSELIADGAVDTAFQGRPVAYGDGGLMKIIVLMTDGQNTTQYLLNPSLREGESPVYYNAEEDRYSVYQSSGNSHSSNSDESYYWPHTGEWNDHPYGNGTMEVCEITNTRGGGGGHGGGGRGGGGGGGGGGTTTTVCTEIDEPGTAVRLTFPELWNRVSLEWNVENNYTDMNNAWATWYNAAFSTINGTVKDQRSRHICGAAKDAGIIVYTIGFEAPSSGQRLLKDCASSDGHYFDVDGLEIEDAFSSIAASIRKLRLVQ